MAKKHKRLLSILFQSAKSRSEELPAKFYREGIRAMQVPREDVLAIMKIVINLVIFCFTVIEKKTFFLTPISF